MGVEAGGYLDRPERECLAMMMLAAATVCSATRHAPACGCQHPTTQVSQTRASRLGRACSRPERPRQDSASLAHDLSGRLVRHCRLARPSRQQKYCKSKAVLPTDCTPAERIECTVLPCWGLMQSHRALPVQAKTYGHLPNVLFETFNEPTWQSWSQDHPSCGTASSDMSIYSRSKVEALVEISLQLLVLTSIPPKALCYANMSRWIL